MNEINVEFTLTISHFSIRFALVNKHILIHEHPEIPPIPMNFTDQTSFLSSGRKSHVIMCSK